MEVRRVLFAPQSIDVQKGGDVAAGIKLISIKASISMAEPLTSHPMFFPVTFLPWFERALSVKEKVEKGLTSMGI